MAADPINSYDATEPKSTTKVKNGPTVIPANWDAVENMVGLNMKGLVITQTAGKTATIDYDSLTLVLNTATPPLIFTDLSPTQIAMDWDNGVAMNGRETGLATTVGWKYLWVFRDPVNGVTSGLWSAATAIGSVAEPDANFKFGRLVGAGYWDGASAFTAFIQRNNRVTLNAGILILDNGTASAWTSISLSAVVPTIARRANGTIAPNVAGSSDRWVRVELAADTSANYANATVGGQVPGVGIGNYTQGYWEQELTSQAVAYKGTTSGGALNIDISLRGYWLDI